MRNLMMAPGARSAETASFSWKAVAWTSAPSKDTTKGCWGNPKRLASNATTLVRLAMDLTTIR